MTKTKFFVFAVLTVMMAAFVSCGKKADVIASYKGEKGTFVFTPDSVEWENVDGENIRYRGSYDGDPSKDGVCELHFKEANYSGKGFEKVHLRDPMEVSIENGVLTMNLYYSIDTFDLVK